MQEAVKRSDIKTMNERLDEIKKSTDKANKDLVEQLQLAVKKSDIEAINKEIEELRKSNIELINKNAEEARKIADEDSQEIIKNLNNRLDEIQYSAEEHDEYVKLESLLLFLILCLFSLRDLVKGIKES